MSGVPTFNVVKVYARDRPGWKASIAAGMKNLRPPTDFSTRNQVCADERRERQLDLYYALIPWAAFCESMEQRWHTRERRRR